MSPASKEEIAAVIAETQRIHDSQPPNKVILDAQGHDPVQDKKPWWKTAVPAWITGSLLGGILGVGVAWGGMTAANAEQDKAIDKVEKDATKTSERLHAVELDAAALKAGNAAQHEALSEKVDAVKKSVDDLKAETKEANDKLEAKLDRLLAAVKKL